jgi:D-hexose-6-phosphate mutarotase
MWGSDFVLDLRFHLTDHLEMKLTVTNTGESPLRCEAALHTYYIVSDVRQIAVEGLRGAEYLDKPDGNRRKTEHESAIRFTGETDRIYLNTESTCVIDDPGLDRRIIVEKVGSKSTVVWNPFPARAGALGDLGADHWAGFVCIETANVNENALSLDSGRSHEMTARVRVVER